MTPSMFLAIALFAIVSATLMAIGGRILVDFSRRDLDIYCRRHRMGERFAMIMATHDQVALAVDSVRTVSVVVAIASGSLYFLQSPTSEPISFGRFLVFAGSAIFILLMLLHWIPLATVKLFSAPLLTRTWLLWRTVAVLAFPLTLGVALFSTLLRRASGRPKPTDEEGEEAFEDEIRAIVTSGMREGFMEEDAREMIEGVMDLGDRTAENIMTSRNEVDAISSVVDWAELLNHVTLIKRTRVPVYSNSLDEVIGVLYVKDLLPELAKSPEERRTLAEIAPTPWFVPDSIPVDDLLQEFLGTRMHLAIVVDEYGAIAGVVTIEDVLEEIVGEIQDESDAEQAPQEFETIDSQTAIVAAQTQIEDVNDRLGIAIPESDVYDTLGGFVIANLGYIPEPGEMISENGYELTVMESNRRRVIKVMVKQLSSQRESA